MKGYSKKSQISLFLIVSLIVVFILLLLFTFKNQSIQKEASKELSKQSDFQIYLSNFDSFSQNCLKEVFDNALNKYGFEKNKISEFINTTFVECLNGFSQPDIEIIFDSGSIGTNVDTSEDNIIITVKMKTIIRQEEKESFVDEYKYEFSKTDYENLNLDENNRVASETQVLSSDKNAILILEKGNFLTDINKQPVSRIVIKAEEKPELSFLIGKFVYDFSPDGMVSESPMILTIRYENEWLNGASPKELRIAYYYEPKKEWRFLPTIVDVNNKELIIFTNHFSIYGIALDNKKGWQIEEKDGEIYMGGFYEGGSFDEGDARIVKRNSDSNENKKSEKCTNNINSKNSPYFLSEDINYVVVDNEIDNFPITLSGCVDYERTEIYELNFDGNIDTLSVISKENINIQKQKILPGKVNIYVRAEERKDYELKIAKKDKTYQTLDFPAYDDVSIGWCYGEEGYSVTEDYIHAGTDINTAGYVTSACNGKIIGIWNKKLDLTPNCQQKLKLYSYYKEEPHEEDPQVKNKYGNTVIILCDENNPPGQMYLIYMHLSDDNFYFRDVNTEYLDLCIDDKIKKGQIVGVAGTTGKYTTGPHLHFEIRLGLPKKETGVPPRENAVSPEKVLASLSEKFKTIYHEGSTHIYDKKIEKGVSDCTNTGKFTRGATEQELFPYEYN